MLREMEIGMNRWRGSDHWTGTKTPENEKFE
jgi:hypothetical protein